MVGLSFKNKIKRKVIYSVFYLKKKRLKAVRNMPNWRYEFIHVTLWHCSGVPTIFTSVLRYQNKIDKVKNKNGLRKTALRPIKSVKNQYFYSSPLHGTERTNLDCWILIIKIRWRAKNNENLFTHLNRKVKCNRSVHRRGNIWTVSRPSACSCFLNDSKTRFFFAGMSKTKHPSGG